MPRPSVRGKLLETALEQFQAQGFNGCGVQDITNAAGVPKGSFYNHFASKEALALEVLEQYSQGSRPDLLTDETVPPIDRLRAHFAFLSDRLEGWHFAKGCLLANFGGEIADTNPAVREAMAAFFERWVSAVGVVLRQAQVQGEIDARHDPDQLARFLVYAWEGAVIGAKVMKSRGPLDDFFAVSFDRLLARPA
ncbi:TetR family transcriptional regulator [Aliidongia dinghuensis]|uniref:TetR family transcriptional regulator n=1 Tax=Aliidongia dinghuensis TaxID=1867774 RepID=A0A8J2YQA6_9PROT|nr:TetR/AcrR family transcriptional regulator [Aliidongia dinghuensis]GGF00025.1 TetR family transcriptional regulator [Aliidongia dinghuensis]